MNIRRNPRKGTWCACANFSEDSTRTHRLSRRFDSKAEALLWLAEQSDHRLDSTTNQSASSARPRLKQNIRISKEYAVQDKTLSYPESNLMSEIEPHVIAQWQDSPISTKVKKNAAGVKFWTREQYERFTLEAMADLAFYCAFEMLYWCGLRVGELLALTYGDIDLQHGTLSINKSYQRLKGQDVITDPKTYRGTRTILLPELLCEKLMRYMALNYGWQLSDRIFTGLTKGHLSRQLKVYAAIAGLEPIRIPDLRHSDMSPWIIESSYHRPDFTTNQSTSFVRDSHLEEGAHHVGI